MTEKIKRFPYHKDYHNFDLDFWNARCLRIDDQFHALAYAHGISYNQLQQDFSWFYNCNNNENFIDLISKHDITIDNQVNYIERYKTRTPQNVLEIGAGRGEVSCALKKLGIDVTPVDVAIDINDWSTKTGNHFFGDKFEAPVIIEGNIDCVDLKLDNFDTILIVETLEHIHEEDFQNTWNKIISNFHGLFIVTNLIGMHPIPVGGDFENAELMHCRLIDDHLYDSMSEKSKSVVFRHGSHLVLEF